MHLALQFLASWEIMRVALRYATVIIIGLWLFKRPPRRCLEDRLAVTTRRKKTPKGQQKEITGVEPLAEPPEMTDDDDNYDDRVDALSAATDTTTAWPAHPCLPAELMVQICRAAFEAIDDYTVVFSFHKSK